VRQPQPRQHRGCACVREWLCACARVCACV
jgi:hypothetical protein